MLLHHRHLPATATIVSVRQLHRGSTDHTLGKYEWVADVTPPDGAPFRTVIGMPHFFNDFRAPSAGMTVAVRWYPHDNSVQLDTSDPQMSWKRQRKLQEEREAADLAAPPGTPPAG